MKYQDLLFGSGFWLLLIGLFYIVDGNKPIEPIILIFNGSLNILIGVIIVILFKIKEDALSSINEKGVKKQ